MERTDEIWVAVPDFPGYQVSSYGNVYNAKMKRNVQPRNDRGYLKVTLSDGVNRKDVHVHRLVGELFLGDFREGYQLEHIDKDRTNNYVGNLKPRGGNTLAVMRYQASHIRGGKVRVVETNQVFINAYSLARHFGVDPSSVYKVLRGERKRVYGMRVEFYREEDHDEYD